MDTLGPDRLTVLTLTFLLVAAGLFDDVRGLAGGDGEMKYLLGDPFALIRSTSEFVRRTETM